MIIRGTDDLAKKIVEFVEREKQLSKEADDLLYRYDTASNLKQQDQMNKIDAKAHKFNHRYFLFLTEKVTVMTMYISKHNNFVWN